MFVRCHGATKKYILMAKAVFAVIPQQKKRQGGNVSVVSCNNFGGIWKRPQSNARRHTHRGFWAILFTLALVEFASSLANEQSRTDARTDSSRGKKTKIEVETDERNPLELRCFDLMSFI